MDNLIAALEFEIIREHKLITICQNFLNTAQKVFDSETATPKQHLLLDL